MLFFCARGIILCSGDGHLVDKAAFRAILGNRLVYIIYAILRICHLTTQGRYYMFSRVRRASGGVGWVGGVGEMITFVGTFTHIPYYMFSRVRRASGGVGWVGGVGEMITFVGTFTHIPYYMFSRARRASGGMGWVGGWGR